MTRAVLYGYITDTPIGKLLIAGMLPGLLMAAFYSVCIYIWARINIPTMIANSVTGRPVDHALAEGLFAHYVMRFGRPGFTGWEEMGIEDSSQEVLDNLKLLQDTAPARFCPGCPGCQMVKAAA